MKKLNLREAYPDLYDNDFCIEVNEAIQECIRSEERTESNYLRKCRRHQAIYSLDHDIDPDRVDIMQHPSPEEILLQQLQYEQIRMAIKALPPKEARRVYSYYYLKMSYAEIAAQEMVTESAIRKSISASLKRMYQTMMRFPE